MDELLDTILTGAKWLAIGGAGYFVTLAAVGLGSNLFSKRIRSKGELAEVVDEESKNWDSLDKLDIEVNYCDQYVGCGLNHLRENRWELVLSSWLATHSSVRHEVYHLHRIATKNKMKPKSLFDYWFNEEPRAILYGFLRIKT